MGVSINEYEIRVFGLKHGGQHAIINWIATLFREPVYFFNNCGWGQDPHRTGRTRGTKKKTVLKDIFVWVPRLKNADDSEVEEIRNTPKKCMMYSYENPWIHRINHEHKPATREGFVAPSVFVYDVLIMRDIFNLAASYFKRVGRVWQGSDTPGQGDLALFDNKNYSDRKKFNKLYVLCAKEFLNRTNHMREKKVCISFNDWFLSKGYRECVAAKFGFPNNEASLDYVAAVRNRGSRFNGMEYEGRAREMNILERWKYFRDNRTFWEIMGEWIEAVELSNEIFGEIPGTMGRLDNVRNGGV